jgi:hypothetical protein
MTLAEIALVSVATGFVLSGLCLAFCRLGLDIIGGLLYKDKTLSEFTTVSLQAVVSFVIVSLAVVPLYSIVQARRLPAVRLRGVLLVQPGDPAVEFHNGVDECARVGIVGSQSLAASEPRE